MKPVSPKNIGFGRGRPRFRDYFQRCRQQIAVDVGARICRLDRRIIDDVLRTGNTACLDLRAGRIELFRRGMILTERRSLSFEQVRYFRLVEQNDGSETISLVLGSGEILPVIEQLKNVEEFECRYLLEINELLRTSRSG